MSSGASSDWKPPSAAAGLVWNGKRVDDMSLDELRSALPLVTGNNGGMDVDVPLAAAIKGRIAQLEVPRKAAEEKGAALRAQGANVDRAVRYSRAVEEPANEVASKAFVRAPSSNELVVANGGVAPYESLGGMSGRLVGSEATFPLDAAKYVWGGGSPDDAAMPGYGTIPPDEVDALRQLARMRAAAAAKVRAFQESERWDAVKAASVAAGQARINELIATGVVDEKDRNNPDVRARVRDDVRKLFESKGLPLAPPSGYVAPEERPRLNSSANDAGKRKLDELALRIDALPISTREKMRMLERMRGALA